MSSVPADNSTRHRASRISVTSALALGLVGAGIGLAGPASADTAAPAVAPAPAPSVITASAPVVDFDRRATVTLHVRTASGHGIPRAYVRVAERTAHGTVHVTAVRANASGVAHFSTTLEHSTAYVFSYGGGHTTLASHTVRPAATAYTIKVRSFGESLVHQARLKIGSPYRYGATGPTRFDCSGFTRYIAAKFGKHLVHSSSGQYSEVRHISKSAARPGDLVFFYSGSHHIYHVGIYAGSGRMVAATHTGDFVRYEKIYTSHYLVGRLATP